MSVGTSHTHDTLELRASQVSDVSALISPVRHSIHCPSLYTLAVAGTQVSDVTEVSTYQSLHALNISKTRVSGVFALTTHQ
jgi:hypothetical protein